MKIHRISSNLKEREKRRISGVLKRSNLKILGIDPGLKETGYGIIDENYKLIDFGIIKGKDFFEQIKKFEKIIGNKKIDFAFIEDVFSYKNPRLSLKLGEVRGAFIYLLKKRKIKVLSLTNSEIKRILTGNGRASKRQVQFMVSSFLSLRKNIPEHVSDALACAIAGFLNKENVL